MHMIRYLILFSGINEAQYYPTFLGHDLVVKFVSITIHRVHVQTVWLSMSHTIQQWRLSIEHCSGENLRVQTVDVHGGRWVLGNQSYVNTVSQGHVAAIEWCELASSEMRKDASVFVICKVGWFMTVEL